MAQTIQLKRSSVAGNLPTSSDLALGEIAINTADGAVYIKKGNNDIVAVADNDILHIDTTNSRVQVGFSGTSIDNNARLQIKGFSGGYARITMQDVDGTNQKTYFSQSSGSTTISTQNDTNYGNFVIQGWNGSAQAEFMRVVGSTGYVGIGITSPEKKLHVQDSSNQIRIEDSSNGKKYDLNVDASDFMIDDMSAGVNRFTIANGGNVGIGTSDPQYKFDVYGTDDVTMRIHRPSSGLAATDTVGIGFSQRGDTTTSSSDTRAGIFSTYNGDLFLAVEAGGNLNSNPMDHSALFIEGADGDIGIGTTSPGTKLDITTAGVQGILINQDTSNASVSSRLLFKDSTRTNAIFNVNGNLEVRTGATIGSTSGTQRLAIKGDGTITFNNAYTFPAADGSANQVLKTDGSGNLSFAAQSGGSSNAITDADGDTKIQVEESSDEDVIRFDTAGTERMTIGATGIVTTTGAIVSGDDIILNNDKDVIFRNASGSDDGTKITRVCSRRYCFVDIID